MFRPPSANAGMNGRCRSTTSRRRADETLVCSVTIHTKSGSSADCMPRSAARAAGDVEIEEFDPSEEATRIRRPMNVRSLTAIRAAGTRR